MLSAFLLIAIVSCIAGTPFSSPTNDVVALEGASFDAPGANFFDQATSSTDNAETNVGATQIFSQPSPVDNALFTDDPADTSGLNIGGLITPADQSSTLAGLPQGGDGNIFATPFDDGLPEDFLPGDEPVGVAGDPSVLLVDAGDNCLSEGTEAYGKRKRLICPNPESQTSTENETPIPDEKPVPDEKPKPGWDEPNLPQTTLCLEGYAPVCCAGQDSLGLYQTGCAACRIPVTSEHIPVHGFPAINGFAQI